MILNTATYFYKSPPLALHYIDLQKNSIVYKQWLKVCNTVLLYSYIHTHTFCEAISLEVLE